MRAFFVSLAVAALAACSEGPPSPLTASLVSGPPGSDHQLGGSVDAVNYDEETGRLEISGWHMLTPETKVQDLKIYANNAVSVESIVSVPRPDVVAAAGNEDLANSGFKVVVRTDPATPLKRLCVSMTDKKFGSRLLGAHDSRQPQCFPVE